MPAEGPGPGLVTCNVGWALTLALPSSDDSRIDTQKGTSAGGGGQ